MTENLQFGDLAVLHECEPSLANALSVIAELHSEFGRQSWIVPGWSKQSCILCALTVRDVLHRIGFGEAKVRAVSVVIEATQAGRELHSLQIGVPGDIPQQGRWPGHLVTLVPSVCLLVDTTLYQAIRPEWDKWLTGMMAVTYRPEIPQGILQSALLPDEESRYELRIRWYDWASNNGWRASADTQKSRRQAVVEALCARYRRLTDQRTVANGVAVK